METSILSPIIVGLVWAFNGLGLPKKFSPLIAIGIGLLMAWSYNQDLWQGVAAGLVAVGLYSGTKNTYQAFVNK